MAWLKNWAYILCCCSLLLALLENGAPVKKTQPVIKLVAGLYILTVMAMPLRSTVSLELPVLSSEVQQTQALQDTPTGQALCNAVRENLVQTLRQQLQAAGAADPAVEIEMATNEEGLFYVARANVTCEENPQYPLLLRQLLGKEAEIYLNGEKI